MSIKTRPHKPVRQRTQAASDNANANDNADDASSSALPVSTPTITTVEWQFGDSQFDLPVSQQGHGPSALLLPSLSPISTYKEMVPLQAALADHYSTLLADWPGFGSGATTATELTPATLDAWLQHIIAVLMPQPKVVIAAGHAAGYVLRLVSRFPNLFEHVVLIAPTFLGPLSERRGHAPEWSAIAANLVRTFPVAQAVQRIATSPVIMRRVIYKKRFSNKQPASEWISQRTRVIKAPGASLAASNYWAGMLDPYRDEKAWADAGEPVNARLKLIWGDETPPRLRRHMIALARATGTKPLILSRGKLHVHEEFADIVALKIAEFAGR